MLIGPEPFIVAAGVCASAFENDSGRLPILDCAEIGRRAQGSCWVEIWVARVSESEVGRGNSRGFVDLRFCANRKGMIWFVDLLNWVKVDLAKGGMGSSLNELGSKSTSPRNYGCRELETRE